VTESSTGADSKLLSVLIPTYKRPDFLALALDSVAAQTRRADEVIVVDNDEAKSAAETVEAYRGSIPNLNYVPESAQAGASFAMNVAGHTATGDWLVFLDDDDYWAPEYLATVHSVISNGEVDFTVTWIAYDYDGVIRGGKKMPRNITIEQILRAGNPGFVGTNIAIEKSLYERLGGLDESMPSSSDVDFLIRMIESGAKYDVIEAELTFLRQHTGPRLTDLSAGYRAVGAAKLLEKHGHKISWSTRRILRGRMHANAFAVAQIPMSRWRHAIMAAVNGNRSNAKEFLKRPW
jgi:glycosyltransferase involved in cell wall biosynthesis